MKNLLYLDLRSIYFTSVLAFAACTLVIGLIWHQSRNRFAGMGFLVLDFGMQTAAILLITLRGVAPDWLSIAVAQIFVLSESILGLMGLERFVGKPTSQFYNACLLVVYSTAFGYFVRVHEASALRDLVFSMGTLVVWFQCAWLMLVRVHPGMRALTFGVGVIFGIYSFVNAFRIAALLGQLAWDVPFVSSGTVLMLVIPMYQGLFILLTVSVMLMVNKRLLMEIGKEEEKFAKAFQFSSESVVLARLSDARITEVNRQFENLSGYAYRDAIGRTVEELGLWADAKERADTLDELKAKGFVHNRECRFRTRGGEVLTGILQAELLTIYRETFILTSFNDITRRKKAEEQLEQLNRSLQGRVDEEIEKRLLHERLLVNQSRLAAMGKMIGAIAHQWRQPLSTLSMMVQRFYATAGFQMPTREQLDQFKAGAEDISAAGKWGRHVQNRTSPGERRYRNCASWWWRMRPICGARWSHFWSCTASR